MTNDKTETLNRVQQMLEGYSIEEALELLANVFIRIGTPGLKTDEQLTTDNIIELVLNDIEENGETLHNATVRQGLTVLSWLDKEE